MAGPECGSQTGDVSNVLLQDKTRQVALFIKDKFSAADTNSKNTSMTYQM